MTNPNDEIRTQILTYFYERNRKATSERGKNGSHVKISDVKAGLKKQCGLSQQEVVSNLTYLLNKGWVDRFVIERKFSAPRGTAIDSSQTWYVITAAGIDRMEEESEFKSGGRFDGINISTLGPSVVSVGNGNVVNARFVQVESTLRGFRAETLKSDELSDRAKVDLVSDIDTLAGQLSKAEPEPSVIQAVAANIERAAAGTQLADFAARLIPMLAGIF